MEEYTSLNRFPRRIYTVEEFFKARRSIEGGHKHRLRISGGPCFKKKIKVILSLIKKVGYYDFLRIYIRKLSEIEGLSQLREAEATIWLNSYVVSNPIEGARFIIQKSYQMKAYLDGKQYYQKGEQPAIDMSIVFLKKLEEKLTDVQLKDICKELIKKWTEETVL